MKDEIFGFYFDKEAFVAGLLSEAEKAGAEVLPATAGIAAENTSDGVKVLTRGKLGEQTLEARTAIAADGLNSKIVESLGLNREREVFIPRYQDASYDVEGVEPDFPGHETSILMVKGKRGFTMALTKGNSKHVSENYKEASRNPKYAHWFHNARVIKEYAVSVTVLSPIGEPVAGNVVVIGDAAAPIETWTQGAVACGYQAVKAIEKELNGQKGYSEYVDW